MEIAVDDGRMLNDQGVVASTSESQRAGPVNTNAFDDRNQTHLALRSAAVKADGICDLSAGDEGILRGDLSRED
ncbi:hypothetical protein [Paraburkholderia gardini]|uniref:Uncharacterized protein n=1 Tax=Paraburkholderia gardini TaxID=2823469 RepID=A0ABM8TYQ0_9BURK|nr:hypothetical protein [Paraburkholderia gardini]CAG4888965.1 hypothetical protein R54767_00609 [Paraburkholderia gardini]CAG4896460.1 hypothetical protein R69919_02188 [Paraburkholderia gardini]